MWNAWYRIDDHTWWVLLWWLAPSEADMPPKEGFCSCHQQPDESLQGHGCSSTKYARVPPCPCSPDTLPITVHGTPVVLIHRLPSPPQPSHHQELLILFLKYVNSTCSSVSAQHIHRNGSSSLSVHQIAPFIQYHNNCNVDWWLIITNQDQGDVDLDCLAKRVTTRLFHFKVTLPIAKDRTVWAIN